MCMYVCVCVCVCVGGGHLRRTGNSYQGFFYLFGFDCWIKYCSNMCSFLIYRDRAELQGPLQWQKNNNIEVRV